MDNIFMNSREVINMSLYQILEFTIHGKYKNVTQKRCI